MTVALMVCVFMVLSLKGLCLCIFVLRAQIHQEKNCSLVTLKTKVSRAGFLLLLTFEWCMGD